MTNIARFMSLLQANGSDVTYHREDFIVACPCRTPEGFRSPKWHIDHLPGAPNSDLAGPPWNGINPPVCNEQGMQPGMSVNLLVKGFVQPVQARAVRSMTREFPIELFGEVQTDDHLGIFPLVWSNITLNFWDWSDTGEDYLMYDTRRYIVVGANKIPDPSGGGGHHWETGLRLVKTARPS
jgi:hypothetical protein